MKKIGISVILFWRLDFKLKQKVAVCLFFIWNKKIFKMMFLSPLATVFWTNELFIIIIWPLFQKNEFQMRFSDSTLSNEPRFCLCHNDGRGKFCRRQVKAELSILSTAWETAYQSRYSLMFFERNMNLKTTLTMFWNQLL